jgi:hypothetical protein
MSCVDAYGAGEIAGVWGAEAAEGINAIAPGAASRAC